MSARTIMIQGTGSHVGKSVITAAFCRLFARAGYRVAPFKAQNMSNNSFVTKEGGEIGRAQAYQAFAAGIEPHVDMNPVLLKPASDTTAQVVLLGKSAGTMGVQGYYDYQSLALSGVRSALERLCEAFEIVVIEGAGSPAEVNLRDRDIGNMRVAEMARCPVLLVGDIERGGVFAALWGTMDLLEPEERSRVKGFIVNKFRGDLSLLTSGLEFIERRTGVPVLGVLPFVFGLDVEEEDAVAIERAKLPPSESSNSCVVVSVVRLPHISNATDFQVLARSPGVDVRYADSARALEGADLVILPGTKSTVADLLWLEQQGLDVALRAHVARGGSVLGICGGYQMLGQELRDESGVESPRGTWRGLGFLPVVTYFEKEKLLARVEGECSLPGLEGARVRGYEIHQGRTVLEGGVQSAFRVRSEGSQAEQHFDGAWSRGPVFGTYLHGLLDHSDFRTRFLNQLRVQKGLPELAPHGYDTRPKGFDELADLLRDHLDLSFVSELVGLSLGYEGLRVS